MFNMALSALGIAFTNDIEIMISLQGGEWVIAYQADQRRHLQAVIVPLVKEHARESKILRPPTNTREASGVPRKVLDRAFLLKHCYGQEPGDLCVCNVSGRELQDVSRQ